MYIHMNDCSYIKISNHYYFTEVEHRKHKAVIVYYLLDLFSRFIGLNSGRK